MTIQQIRRANLVALIDKMGGQVAFIERTGRNQGQVSSLTKSKPMGEKLARNIERECGLPHGAMDRAGGWDEDPMVDIRAAIARAPWLDEKAKDYFVGLIGSLRKPEQEEARG